MNQYKMAWAANAQCLSPNVIQQSKDFVDDIKEDISWWVNLPPTDPRRLVAHAAALPIAYGAQLAAHSLALSSYAGPGALAFTAGVVFVAATAYFVWSAIELYEPMLEHIIHSSPVLKPIFS
jgi:hypothetical protein